MAESGIGVEQGAVWTPPASLDEARALARARFKERLERGEEVGGCGCAEDDPVRGVADNSPAVCVVGVRFRDSGRVYYFRSEDEALASGDWVVVPTSRGEEAGRVVIAPHQVRQSMLQGELGTVSRKLTEDDIDRMWSYRRSNADAVRIFGERSRARRLGVKPIAADFAFDGDSITFNYSVPDRERGPDANAMRHLAADLASEFGCRVEMRQVGPRDEARLLGGLGRCGRTLCCSSWLPVFPEISMSMAKNQDLPLNPSKVSGVCGRLLCCLSYENDQYRQMKSVMPRLGQPIETPSGPGVVVAMHLLKELVTVRLEEVEGEVVFTAEDLGLGAGRNAAPPVTALRVAVAADEPEPAPEQVIASEPTDTEPEAPTKKRRRRKGGRRSGSRDAAGS